MTKIFIIILIVFIVINIKNGMKLSKTESKMNELMYTSLTSLYFLISIGACKLIEKISNTNLAHIEYLDIIILVTICMMFVIVNGFILIAKSNTTNSKRTLFSGFWSMLLFPLQMFLAIPILLIIMICKIKENKNHEIKVYEEEIYDIDYDYTNN